MTELAVEMCDPRTRESEIKGLFARNGQTRFGAVFDRAYRTRAEAGFRSWIGLVDDRAVMHISVTPVRFVNGDASMTVGILGDLMVDESHRDFWAPVRLLRQMMADLKRAGTVDYLVSTTVAEAESVFKAGGFKPFGTLRRYVLPASRVYIAFAALRGRVGRTRMRVLGHEFPGKDRPGLGRSGTWGPEPAAAYYETRIPRAEFSDGTWIAVTRSDDASPGHALVSRNGEIPEASLADAFWGAGTVRLGNVAHAAGRWAAASGMKKLVLTTLQESDVAQQLVAAGFFPRDVRSSLLLQKLTRDAPPPVNEWFLPGFAFNSW